MKENLVKLLKNNKAYALILQNCDDFSFEHCENSHLHKITGFSGTAGEGILTADNEIFLFVDPRYHIQADKSAKCGVKVIKLEMKESFLDVLGKILPKNAKILIDEKFVTLQMFDKIKKKFKNLTAADFVPRRKVKISKKPHQIYEPKFEQLKNKMAKHNADNILITNLDDGAYISGLRAYDMPYSSAPRLKILIKKTGIEYFGGELKEIKGKTIVFKERLSLADFKKVKNPLILKQNPIAKMAAVKTPKEIENLKTSFEKLDLALKDFKAKIKTGMSELELKELLEREIFKKGAQALSFKTILSIGANTASIHYSALDKNKFLKPDDLILLDCGGYFDGGIATDITRVISACRPTQKQKQVYTLVLKSFLNVYNKNLASGFELDEMARKILKKAPEGFLFSHSLGHGVGVNVHSALPLISSADKKHAKLKPNMVFTLEPGLYREGEFGIRLENTVYIDKTGKKVSFSKFPFEENLIDKKLLTKQELKWLEVWNG